jgi:hypothetical protein
MMKHMIGQAIYQITVLYVVLFGGEYFLPEKDGYKSDDYALEEDGLVHTGRRYTYGGKENEEGLYTKDMYTVSNQFNYSAH